MAKLKIHRKQAAEKDPLRDILAQNIRRLRIEQAVSQEELAFRCELDRTYISAIERCVWNISLGNIEKIAAALNVEPWQLLVAPKN
jgi:transcriptional regulator with XRE-family HTH domain